MRPRYDVAPARELEIPVAWINRNDDPPSDSARPDPTFDDLGALADWLTR